MRHRVATKSFNRDTKERQALFKSLVRALIEQGEIETTVAKAKVIKSISDKILSKATVDTITNRRVLHTFFGKRDVVNTIFEKVIPAAEGRTSGFTRIQKLGKRRGDNSETALLSLVGKHETAGTLRNSVASAKRLDNKKAIKAKTSVAKTASTKKTAKKKVTIK